MTGTVAELPLGMTKTPYGWPAMSDAFIGCAVWAAGQKEIVEQFEQDTGHKIKTFVGRSPIEKMFDWSIGRDREILGKWLDWVTANIWGDDDDDVYTDL